MVEQRTLTPLVLVRIQVPQPPFRLPAQHLSRLFRRLSTTKLVATSMLMRSPLTRERRSTPGFIRPCLLTPATTVPTGPDWRSGERAGQFAKAEEGDDRADEDHQRAIRKGSRHECGQRGGKHATDD
jgi:hypothetical protein